MGAPRWPSAAVGAAALAGALGWFLTRPSASSSRSQPPASPGSSAGPAAVSAPAGPSLAGSAAPPTTALAGSAAAEVAPGVAAPPADGGPTAGAGPAADAVAFRAQVRDPAWAGATEQTIQRRLAAVPALRSTECRHDTCELTLGGSSETVAEALATIEGRAGLRDIAAHVLLTAPETADGALTLRAYVTFAR